jgi:hypothetical protein
MGCLCPNRYFLIPFNRNAGDNVVFSLTVAKDKRQVEFSWDVH